MYSLFKKSYFFQSSLCAYFILVCLYQLNVQCSNLPISTCSIPDACISPTNRTSQDFRKECQNRTFSIDSKCCFDNQTLVGLDLTNCSLPTLDFLSNYTRLVILDLRDNPLKNVTSGDFRGLTSLDALFLPNNVSCPGDWEPADWENCSVLPDGCKCRGQIDLCIRNVSCDDNGLCEHLGPGLARCSCKEGFYGYRCLRTGHFPVLSFVVGLSVPCLILSAFFWFTQRRHVKMQ